MVTTTKTAPVSDLEALAQQAESMEAEAVAAAPGAPGEPATPEPEKLSNAQILSGGLIAGRGVFCSVTKFESPKTTLSDDSAHRLGEVWGPLFTKWGIELGDYVGEYALELAAIVVTAEIGLSVRAGVVAEMIARDQKPEANTATLHSVN